MWTYRVIKFRLCYSVFEFYVYKQKHGKLPLILEEKLAAKLIKIFYFLFFKGKILPSAI